MDRFGAETKNGSADPVIKAAIGEAHDLRSDVRLHFAAAGSLHPPHFKEIAKIRREIQGQAEFVRVAVEIAQPDPLVTDRVPKEFRPPDCNRVTWNDRCSVPPDDLGIGEVYGQGRIVILDDRAEQERAPILEEQLQPRQMPGVVAEQPFRGVRRDPHVAIAIENGEGVAGFQGTQWAVDERRVRIESMIGRSLVRRRDVALA